VVFTSRERSRPASAIGSYALNAQRRVALLAACASAFRTEVEQRNLGRLITVPCSELGDTLLPSDDRWMQVSHP
jgi:hypothetical protein